MKKLLKDLLKLLPLKLNVDLVIKKQANLKFENSFFIDKILKKAFKVDY